MSINQQAIDTVRAIADATGVAVHATADTLIVDGTPVDLPTVSNQPRLVGEVADLIGIKGLLPTVPHGDDRDKLLWRIVGEAQADPAPDAWNPPPLDRDLRNDLAGLLPFAAGDARTAVAQAVNDRFFSRKQRTPTKAPVYTMLPIHSTLPLNYAHALGKTSRAARYRMFSAEIIVFLMFDETTNSTDTDLLAQVLDFFSTDDDLTSLDRMFVSIAREHAKHPDATPQAQELVNRYEPGTRKDLKDAGGAFCTPSLAQFRRDLRTVLTTELPRPDKVQWLTVLLSLHLAVRMYRLAVVKGNDLDLAIARATSVPPPTGTVTCPCPHITARPAATDPTGAAATTSTCLTACPLAGAIRFRTGTGRYRPITRRDGCRESYVDLDQRRLLALPATLVTSNLARRAWTALGGPAHESASMTALAEALNDDATLNLRFSAICAAIAALHHAAHKPAASRIDLETTAGLVDAKLTTHGLVALRDSVLRERRGDLRHQSRDVVNQLVLDANISGGGSLVSRNGSHTFFEVDERMLLLLVRLICRTEAIPYDEFLRGLTTYGMAPQDTDERAALADSLERLGLLVRYSDAGEASFVHYN